MGHGVCVYFAELSYNFLAQCLLEQSGTLCQGFGLLWLVFGLMAHVQTGRQKVTVVNVLGFGLMWLNAGVCD